MAPIHSVENTHSNNYVPYIIGMSLMGAVIFALTIALIICYCSRRSKYKFNNSDNINLLKKEDISAPIEFNRVTINPVNRKTIPLPSIEKINNEDIEMENFKRAYISNFTKKRFRRGSVPASLDTVLEVPFEKDSFCRKKSLSNDCIEKIRPNNSLNYDSSLKFDNDIHISSVERKDINFRFSEYQKPQSPEFINMKYSIYNDQNLLRDDETYSRYGKIYFSLYYNIDTKSLEVTIKKAQHLSGMKYKGKNRYYIKLKLKKSGITAAESCSTLSGVPENVSLKAIRKKNTNTVQKKFRTSIKADFCNPNFEETFVFSGVTPIILQEYDLEMLVKEETPKFLANNRALGYVDFILRDALLIEKQESLTDIVRDIIPLIEPKENGHISLGLQYSQSLSTLNVWVKALILNSTINIGGVDDCTSVELHLRSIDDIIVSKYKVSIGDEPTSLQLDHCFLNSVCLVVVVTTKIRNCARTPCSKIIVGPIRFTDGPGLAHWIDMSVGTVQPVVRTYILY